jgi:hypothetical protein
MARKASQWVTQYRKNWSNTVAVDQIYKAVGIAFRQTDADDALFRHWSVWTHNDGIHRVDGFARTGQLGGGASLPAV